MPIGVIYCIDKITFLVECYTIGKKHSDFFGQIFPFLRNEPTKIERKFKKLLCFYALFKQIART
jgi:hypothetical protein